MHFDAFSLSDWLEYWENKHSQAIQLGLTRVKSVGERLDLLSPEAIVITVAGTNGKGSTVAALEAIYSAAGYRVASYTSPHLLVFNERIRVNQQPISDADLCAAFCIIEEARNRFPDVSLTYFEAVTLAALQYFKTIPLDIIILEVGMGGRLDATNVIDSDLAILTTVDLDHQRYLGENKEAIGYEKAGIIRENKPCIYADSDPPTSVLAYAKDKRATLYRLHHDYTYRIQENGLQVSIFETEELVLPSVRIHPQAAAAAMFATHCLASVLPIQRSHWERAIPSVFLPGRVQVIPGPVTTILDVSHNPQAVRLLASQVSLFRKDTSVTVHAVFSALEDKDIAALIQVMYACVDNWYPAVLHEMRGATRALLQEAFAVSNHPISMCYNTPSEAYQAALASAKPGDVIVVYGSFLTVSAIINQEVVR